MPEGEAGPEVNPVPEDAPATDNAAVADPEETLTKDATAASTPAPPVDPTPPSGVPSGLPAAAATDYTDSGVPNLDYLRDKVEAKYANAMGATELARNAEPARTHEQQAADRAQAAKDRLDEIRRSLHPADPDEPA